MNPYVILAALLLLVTSHTATYYVGKKVEAGEAAESQRTGLMTYAEKLKEALDENATNQTTLTKLQSKLSGMQHPNLPTCSSGSSADSGAGLLYEAQNTAFKDLQRGDDEDLARCDRLNIDTIRLNTSLSTTVH